MIKLGYKASAEQFAPGKLLGFSCLAEEVGFDSVFISDHFQPWKHVDGHAPFSLTWLGALGCGSVGVKGVEMADAPEYRETYWREIAADIPSGVLIHVPPVELPDVMRAIVDATNRYVLCIEYDAPVEQMVESRAHQHRLWRRPFGELYERLGMSVLETGQAEGYVDCKYWLLEK